MADRFSSAPPGSSGKPVPRAEQQKLPPYLEESISQLKTGAREFVKGTKETFTGGIGGILDSPAVDLYRGIYGARGLGTELGPHVENERGSGNSFAEANNRYMGSSREAQAASPGSPQDQLIPMPGETIEQYQYRQDKILGVKPPKPGGLYPKGREREYSMHIINRCVVT